MAHRSLRAAPSESPSTSPYPTVLLSVLPSSTPSATPSISPIPTVPISTQSSTAGILTTSPTIEPTSPSKIAWTVVIIFVCVFVTIAAFLIFYCMHRRRARRKTRRIKKDLEKFQRELILASVDNKNEYGDAPTRDDVRNMSKPRAREQKKKTDELQNKPLRTEDIDVTPKSFKATSTWWDRQKIDQLSTGMRAQGRSNVNLQSRGDHRQRNTVKLKREFSRNASRLKPETTSHPEGMQGEGRWHNVTSSRFLGNGQKPGTKKNIISSSRNLSTSSDSYEDTMLDANLTVSQVLTGTGTNKKGSCLSGDVLDVETLNASIVDDPVFFVGLVTEFVDDGNVYQAAFTEYDEGDNLLFMHFSDASFEDGWFVCSELEPYWLIDKNRDYIARWKGENTYFEESKTTPARVRKKYVTGPSSSFTKEQRHVLRSKRKKILEQSLQQRSR